MVNALEIAKVMVKPAEKLIDNISNAIGKVYEPFHIKRIADAKSYEIRKISESLVDCSFVPIQYENDCVSMNTADWDDLVKRTHNRLGYQEICKQLNIEKVVYNAYSLLENADEVENNPIDHDWLNRLFNCVEDISNDDMSMLWAKVLAGETMFSNSFSLRTLETLKNLSQHEALLFKKLSKYMLKTKDDVSNKEAAFVLSGMFGGYDNKEYIDLDYEDILTLIDAGIIRTNDNTVLYFDLEAHHTETIWCQDRKILISNKKDSKRSFTIRPYGLTAAGEELLKIVEDFHDKISDKYLEKCKSIIMSSQGIDNSQNIEISII